MRRDRGTKKAKALLLTNLINKLQAYSQGNKILAHTKPLYLQ